MEKPNENRSSSPKKEFAYDVLLNIARIFWKADRIEPRAKACNETPVLKDAAVFF